MALVWSRLNGWFFILLKIDKSLDALSICLVLKFQINCKSISLKFHYKDFHYKPFIYTNEEIHHFIWVDNFSLLIINNVIFLNNYNHSKNNIFSKIVKIIFENKLHDLWFSVHLELLKKSVFIFKYTAHFLLLLLMALLYPRIWILINPTIVSFKWGVETIISLHQ